MIALLARLLTALRRRVGRDDRPPRKTPPSFASCLQRALAEAPELVLSASSLERYLASGTTPAWQVAQRNPNHPFETKE